MASTHSGMLMVPPRVAAGGTPNQQHSSTVPPPPLPPVPGPRVPAAAAVSGLRPLVPPPLPATPQPRIVTAPATSSTAGNTTSAVRGSIAPVPPPIAPRTLKQHSMFVTGSGASLHTAATATGTAAAAAAATAATAKPTVVAPSSGITPASLALAASKANGTPVPRATTTHCVATAAVNSPPPQSASASNRTRPPALPLPIAAAAPPVSPQPQAPSPAPAPVLASVAVAVAAFDAAPLGVGRISDSDNSPAIRPRHKKSWSELPTSPNALAELQATATAIGTANGSAKANAVLIRRPASSRSDAVGSSSRPGSIGSSNGVPLRLPTTIESVSSADSDSLALGYTRRGQRRRSSDDGGAIPSTRPAAAPPNANAAAGRKIIPPPPPPPRRSPVNSTPTVISNSPSVTPQSGATALTAVAAAAVAKRKSHDKSRSIGSLTALMETESPAPAPAANGTRTSNPRAPVSIAKNLRAVSEHATPPPPAAEAGFVAAAPSSGKHAEAASKLNTFLSAIGLNRKPPAASAAAAAAPATSAAAASAPASLLVKAKSLFVPNSSTPAGASAAAASLRLPANVANAAVAAKVTLRRRSSASGNELISRGSITSQDSDFSSTSSGSSAVVEPSQSQPHTAATSAVTTAAASILNRLRPTAGSSSTGGSGSGPGPSGAASPTNAASNISPKPPAPPAVRKALSTDDLPAPRSPPLVAGTSAARADDDADAAITPARLRKMTKSNSQNALSTMIERLDSGGAAATSTGGGSTKRASDDSDAKLRKSKAAVPAAGDRKADGLGTSISSEELANFICFGIASALSKHTIDSEFGVGIKLSLTHARKPFLFKEYAANVFCCLRTHFGVTPQEYAKYLGPHAKLIGGRSAGQSSAFFFFSSDGRFILKTLSRSESQFLRQLLPAYYKYVRKYPHTLIPRFYGFYKIEIDSDVYIHFVTMANVFSARERRLYKRFDLKGSTVGRFAKAKEKLSDSCIYKDLDLMQSGQKIVIDKRNKELLHLQLAHDTKFLEENGVMDYSFLLGIHDENSRESSVAAIKPATDASLPAAATASPVTAAAPATDARPASPPPGIDLLALSAGIKSAVTTSITITANATAMTAAPPMDTAPPSVVSPTPIAAATTAAPPGFAAASQSKRVSSNHMQLQNQLKQLGLYDAGTDMLAGKLPAGSVSAKGSITSSGPPSSTGSLDINQLPDMKAALERASSAAASRVSSPPPPPGPEDAPDSPGSPLEGGSPSKPGAGFDSHSRRRSTGSIDIQLDDAQRRWIAEEEARLQGRQRKATTQPSGILLTAGTTIRIDDSYFRHDRNDSTAGAVPGNRGSLPAPVHDPDMNFNDSSATANLDDDDDPPPPPPLDDEDDSKRAMADRNGDDVPTPLVPVTAAAGSTKLLPPPPPPRHATIQSTTKVASLPSQTSGSVLLPIAGTNAARLAQMHTVSTTAPKFDPRVPTTISLPTPHVHPASVLINNAFAAAVAAAKAGGSGGGAGGLANRTRTLLSLKDSSTREFVKQQSMRAVQDGTVAASTHHSTAQQVLTSRYRPPKKSKSKRSSASSNSNRGLSVFQLYHGGMQSAFPPPATGTAAGAPLAAIPLAAGSADSKSPPSASAALSSVFAVGGSDSKSPQLRPLSPNAVTTPPGVQRREIYYFGIIDMLQRYNARKKLERGVKGLVYASGGVSVQDPTTYANRFLKFMTAAIVD